MTERLNRDNPPTLATASVLISTARNTKVATNKGDHMNESQKYYVKEVKEARHKEHTL